MGLCLYRKKNECLALFIDPQITPDELHRQLKEGIIVRVRDLSKTKACIEVCAPDCIQIIRTDRFTQDQWLMRAVRPWWQRLTPRWLRVRKA